MTYRYWNQGAMLLAAVIVCAGLAWTASPPAYAQSSTSKADSGNASREASNTGCRRRPGMLGVSRKVEIDASGGPRFGLQQYKENDFLRDKEVVLTFDDGPLRRHTRAVLAALASHCTQATFFMVGRMAASDPEMVREVARHGHTVALHTWSHRNLRAIGIERARQEIELGASAVQKALGQPVAPFFRFPYLADSQATLAYLAQRNLAVFYIDNDAYDYRTSNAGTVQRNILRSLESKRKGIALFHDIQPSTARALKDLLDALAERGFKIVHVVAKTRATTLAKYDELAAAEVAKRSRTPMAAMARRSIVYPIANPGVPVVKYTAVPGPARASGDANSGGSRRDSGAERERAKAAPAPRPIAASPPPTAPAPRPGQAVDEYNYDWRSRVFAN